MEVNGDQQLKVNYPFKILTTILTIILNYTHVSKGELFRLYKVQLHS